MKAPQEQQIIDCLAEWLQDITWANGYRTNAGKTVFTDESLIPDEPVADTLLVLDKGTKSLGRGRWVFTVDIEGLVVLTPQDGPSLGRDAARLLLADIRDALKKGRTKRLLPAGAIELRETMRFIPRREPGANLLVPSVTIEIDYSDIFNEEV